MSVICFSLVLHSITFHIWELMYCSLLRNLCSEIVSLSPGVSACDVTVPTSLFSSLVGCNSGLQIHYMAPGLSSCKIR